MTVAAILRHKGNKVTHVAPGVSTAEVVKTLAEQRIGAVLVMDEQRRILGIVSERDIITAMAAHGPSVLQQPADQLMTRSVQTVTPETTVAEAMEMMTAGRFRHIPVLDDGVLVGIVSIGDVVKARIMQTEHEVDSLKAYVAGAA